MAFWPFYMVACVALIFWGYRAGAGNLVPAIILCGLVGMRFVVLMPEQARELAAFIPWLCVAATLMYNKAWLPGVLCLLSGATYPVLLTLGLRIEYLGLVSIVADTFLIAALGFWGLAIYSHTHRDRDRVGYNGLYAAQIMAKSEGLRLADAGVGTSDQTGHEALAGTA